MNELQLISRQQPGIVSIENFDEIKHSLAFVLDRYSGAVYTENKLTEAKADKKELSRLRKDVDERRKDIKRSYLKPYEDFAEKVKELITMIDKPLGRIDAFVREMDEQEKSAKRNEITGYFFSKCVSLGDIAQEVFDSPAFFDRKWLNKSTSVKTWQSEVDVKIATVTQNIQNLQSIGGQHTGALITKYLETLDTSGLKEYRDKIVAVDNTNADVVAAVLSEDNIVGYKILKLSGTSVQMAQALEQLEFIGIEFGVIEDGMPQPMRELDLPDFDSFVAFDIETTGTYGAANGDAPAEITEIGAVKVVGGQIVKKFSELINPGRKIVPRIAKITGITDDMVAGKQKIDVIIRQFADFVGDSILLGHNIKASDLYYINRAARKAGVRIENPFFDTYRYVRKSREHNGWEKLTLEYLSEQLGITQSNAHRAWCDAEANAKVYLRLKESRL